MAKISKLKVGQVLWDTRRERMGSTTLTRVCVYEVWVKDIDPEGRYIIASWNGNSPKKMWEQEVSKLKVKEPKREG